MTKEKLGEMIINFEHQMYCTSKTILKDDQDCADAIQETIVKAFQKIDTLKKEKYVKTWLIRILINECHNIIRKERTSEEKGLPEEMKEVTIEMGYIPEGMEWRDELYISYKDTPMLGGFSFDTVLLDSNDFGKALTDVMLWKVKKESGEDTKVYIYSIRIWNRTEVLINVCICYIRKNIVY